MEEDDIDDDDQPRVVYADAEREGRMARYAAGVGEGADVSASRGSHGANEGAFAPRGPAPGAAPWASDDDVDGAPPLTLLEEEDERRTRSPARGDGRASAAGARSDAIHPQTLSIHDATANARRGGDRGETLNRAPFSPASGSDDEDVVDASPADAKRANRALGASSIVQNPFPEDAADREFLEETLGNAAAAAPDGVRGGGVPSKRTSPQKSKDQKTQKTGRAGYKKNRAFEKRLGVSRVARRARARRDGDERKRRDE